jgi:hypothetical protein
LALSWLGYVGKAPGKETAGKLAPALGRALWGFDDPADGRLAGAARFGGGAADHRPDLMARRARMMRRF